MVKIRKFVPVVAGFVVLVALASACKTAAREGRGDREGRTASATLSPQNNSGESGTATLTRVSDNQTRVVLSVTGAPAGVAQPVHIHKGSCAQLDPKPAFPLSPLVNGRSESTVPASLDELQKGGYAINGHRSAQEASTYVFCGNIGKM